MRLSDAIALGRTIVPARAGAEWYTDGSGCARGMALEACGVQRISCDPIDSDNQFLFMKYFPFATAVTISPCDCGNRNSIFATISHLFDLHVSNDWDPDWTLDRLIDWVRSVEPAEPETSVVESVPAAEEVPQ